MDEKAGSLLMAAGLEADDSRVEEWCKLLRDLCTLNSGDEQARLPNRWDDKTATWVNAQRESTYTGLDSGLADGVGQVAKDNDVDLHDAARQLLDECHDAAALAELYKRLRVQNYYLFGNVYRAWNSEAKQFWTYEQWVPNVGQQVQQAERSAASIGIEGIRRGTDEMRALVLRTLPGAATLPQDELDAMVTRVLGERTAAESSMPLP